MIGEWILTGTRWGVQFFSAVAVFISLAAMLFVLVYTVAGLIAGEDKDDKRE